VKSRTVSRLIIIRRKSVQQTNTMKPAHVYPNRLQNRAVLHRGYVPPAVLCPHVCRSDPVLLHYGCPQIRFMVRLRRVLCPAVCTAPDMSGVYVPGCLCLRPHTQGICPGKCRGSIQGHRADPDNVCRNCPGLVEVSNKSVNTRKLKKNYKPKQKLLTKF
jgi:hypothetical protein